MGSVEVSVELGDEPFEFTVSVAVDPQFAGGPAPVSLPPGGFPGQDAGQDHGPLVADDGPVRHGLHRTEGQFLRPAAIHRQAVGVGVPAVGLPEGAGDDDVAVGGEALDPGGAVAEVAQLAVAAAVDLGSDNLRGRALDDGPDQVLPVRREAGVACGQLQ